MNKTKLKNYAPQARKDFIAAVSARANQLGLSENGSGLVVSPATRQGDVTLIEGRDWPAKVYGQRERLVKRMQREGFDQTVEAVAYTWFNRFAALRYMELHDYLEHGYRVLSSIGNEGGPAGTPDILLHAVDLAQSQNLPGLNADEVGRLKLAGNQDGELYRKLLIAQCNALSNAMPFLFERIDDETELLLPDNLLRTDSVIAKLVSEIPEEDWQEVEVIGWLYQYYISEKKDQIIGKVVESENIPAATQLFTPNWIVKYLVQNSVGRLWVMATPESLLKSQWEYYIEPAKQTPEVNAQLDALIKTRMDEDGGSLNPETISVLDPACGSGHILVEAYELLKGIYLERGYRLRDIPRLILEKNLYGLDIDDRAAQMAGFALLMKARADDRRLFSGPLAINVISLRESKGLSLDEISAALFPYGVNRRTIELLLETFNDVKTVGALTKISDELNDGLFDLCRLVKVAESGGDLYASTAANEILPLLRQSVILAHQFDVLVANPPYMGGKYYCQKLKSYIDAEYKVGRADLYGVFTAKNIQLVRPGGFVSMITFTSWMFLHSFENLRNYIFQEAPILALAHNGRGVWGSDFGTCSYILQRSIPKDANGTFLKLFEKQGSVSSNEELAARFTNYPRFVANYGNFKKIPGSPVAYWLSEAVREAFSQSSIQDISISDGQNVTADNGRFVRMAWEVDADKIGKNRKWLHYAKGGAFRKWFGNLDHLIDWSEEARQHYRKNSSCRIIPDYLWYRPGVTWTLLAYDQSFRFLPPTATFDKTGSSIFFKDESDINYVLGFLNSSVCSYLAYITNPTVALQVKNVRDLPLLFVSVDQVSMNVNECLKIAEADYLLCETSPGFVGNPLLLFCGKRMDAAYETYINGNREAVNKIKFLEESNNRIFIDAYCLGNEVSVEIPLDKITLFGNPDYRYTGNLSEMQGWLRFREDSAAEFVSYVIGCMMGRYTLDEPGLIYAHSGNVGFDETRYKTFPADADGIVPITDELWFEDDAAIRIREFVRVVWGADTLEENMAWLAESLGKKDSETPDEAVRRYLSDKFFKDHLQTYKKRPIYWLFSSGKQGAFQALVYLHRYHEGTLARMRAEYVVPLTGKIQSRIEMLDKDAESASSTAARNKINKEIEKLRKKHVELLAYDEKLRHYADMRIKLDLDDGVKVNYGKFGDILDSVKAITGGSDE
jgi:hypothetical protein